MRAELRSPGASLLKTLAAALIFSKIDVQAELQVKKPDITVTLTPLILEGWPVSNELQHADCKQEGAQLSISLTVSDRSKCCADVGKSTCT
jgi:hypothetical protein